MPRFTLIWKFDLEDRYGTRGRPGPALSERRPRSSLPGKIVSVIQSITALYALQHLGGRETRADLSFAALVHHNDFRISGSGRASLSGRIQGTLAGILILLDAEFPGAAQCSGKNILAYEGETHMGRAVASPGAGNGKKISG